MPRALVLGNGTFLVTLDSFGFVRDMYFPYVGMENHVGGHKHRIGVWVNDKFSWIDDGSWQISLGYKPETMVGYLVCKNPGLQVSVVMEDIVYNETNVFLRKVNIYNHADYEQRIRIFFHQVFFISESPKRNTAFYDPTHNSIVHYKGRRVFIVNGKTEAGQSIDDFSVGAYGFEGKEGTFKDAEDGELSKNGVEHGSVDSVVRLSATCEGKGKVALYYWICAGTSLDEAYQLNQMVLTKTPQAMCYSTETYWNAWLNKRDWSHDLLSAEHLKLFNTSLFVLRAHTDDRGAIIASADSAMIEYGKDDYSYMWPRDAAFIASVLDKAGFTEATKPFFEFCRDVQHHDGYLHHRFNADQSLGSTWHSALAQKVWLNDKLLQLPIQEDETAGVVMALWHHYEVTRNVEFIEDLYKPFIEKAANFLVSFRDLETGLPLPSYDLWEERMGVSTYTCASVYGALLAAAEICEMLGKRDRMRLYRDTAKDIKKATITHLFDEELGAFVRFVTTENGQVIRHKVVDASSLYGLWYFGMLTPEDSQYQSTVDQTNKRLQNPTAVGGIIRYEGDEYFRRGTLSNPWFITTMWEAQRRLSVANPTQADLDFMKQTLDWVVAHQYPSGVLAEQLDPETGESLSATPLAWSHAVYVESVLRYIQVHHQVTGTEPGSDGPAPVEL